MSSGDASCSPPSADPPSPSTSPDRNPIILPTSVSAVATLLQERTRDIGLVHCRLWGNDGLLLLMTHATLPFCEPPFPSGLLGRDEGLDEPYILLFASRTLCVGVSHVGLDHSLRASFHTALCN